MTPAQTSTWLVRFAVVVSSVGAAGGCGLAASATGPPSTASKPIPAAVIVQNYNQSDVRIYLVSNGRRVVRLGMVPAFDTKTFVLPRVMPPTGKVELIVVPSGLQESQAMPGISVEPGARLLLTVEQNGRFSTVTRSP